MLLEELIQTKSKDVQLKNPINKSRIKLPDNRIGIGTASVVYPDKNDPHMVNKKSTGKRSKDSFKFYANYIIQNKLSESNPYFPRIYKNTNYANGDGSMQKYQMEKLEEYHNIEKEQLKAFLNTIIPTDYKIDYSTYDDHKFVHTNICHIISDAISGFTHSVDENLIECAKLLNQFSNKNDIPIDDIGDNNVLYRRTKYGIHAVIADPVH